MSVANVSAHVPSTASEDGAQRTAASQKYRLPYYVELPRPNGTSYSHAFIWFDAASNWKQDSRIQQASYSDQQRRSLSSSACRASTCRNRHTNEYSMKNSLAQGSRILSRPRPGQDRLRLYQTRGRTKTHRTVEHRPRTGLRQCFIFDIARHVGVESTGSHVLSAEESITAALLLSTGTAKQCRSVSSIGSLPRELSRL